MKEYQYEGDPLPYAKTSWEIESCTMTLKVGLKYYPEELGLLFQKNSDGETSCELVFDEGRDETWRTIEKCFDETRNVKMKMVERKESSDNLVSIHARPSW